ncbi:hypothetical protein AA15669_1641 [Saccharibacter floricola DSM 15669]|uniref:Uncharacterized protein n=2 Tax=Saccharibacter TaxID=231052 RepID=A0ABQ0P0C2_9PROT|nr:hypothetical protein AA15669_1641 [Saccharibacter floricola DSM 15669]
MHSLCVFSSKDNSYIGKISSDILNDLSRFPRPFRTEMFFIEVNMENIPHASVIGRERIIISRDRISRIGKYSSYLEIEAIFLNDIYNFIVEISVSYLKEIYCGEMIKEIDVAKNIHFENGIDHKKEERDALGM